MYKSIELSTPSHFFFFFPLISFWLILSQATVPHVLRAYVLAKTPCDGLFDSHVWYLSKNLKNWKEGVTKTFSTPWFHHDLMPFKLDTYIEGVENPVFNICFSLFFQIVGVSKNIKNSTPTCFQSLSLFFFYLVSYSYELTGSQVKWVWCRTVLSFLFFWRYKYTYLIWIDSQNIQMIFLFHRDDYVCLNEFIKSHFFHLLVWWSLFELGTDLDNCINTYYHLIKHILRLI